MRAIKLAAAISILVVGSSAAMAAQSLQVTKSLKVDMSAEEVWKAIGGFCAIADWHPAVEKCEVSEADGATWRTLSLAGGGVIKEKQTGSSSMAYNYMITESPLPVKNYSALFDVEGDDKSATVGWTASFEADGKPDSEAKDVISGIFTDGLKAIGEKLAK